jgi:adenylate kinase
VVLILIGPPASGKSVQGDYLRRKYGLATVSVEELIADSGAKLRRGDPRVNELVRRRLESLDLTAGLVLDGYPAVRPQADYLAGLLKQRGLPRPIVVQINVPDRVVFERARARGGAGDDPEEIARCLEEYHREMDMIRTCYPEGDVWTIDGTRTVEGVSATIRSLVEDRR